MHIELLGGVQAFGDHAQTLDVGPSKCQTLLAALALSPREAVPVSRLVDVVWDEEPPRTADKTLQSYVVRLRKALGAESIVRVGAAYRLDVHPEAVDAVRFQRRLAAGDVTAALAEWTGVPLAGLDAPGLAPAVDGLVETWLAAVEVDLERRLDIDGLATIAPLTELTAAHPFRERLWELLMTALYRAGRQADALAAFHTVRQHLVDHLGVDPGPRLRSLESRILDQDDLLDATVTTAPSATALPSGTVTFAVAEVDDLSGLWVRHQRKAAAALERLHELIRSTAGVQEGRVFATGEGSVSVAFHRAGDAATWAVQLRQAVHDEPWIGGIALQVRAALHTGDDELRGAGYVGPGVHLVGQLARAGHGGQILVSGATAALLDRGDLRDLGTYRLEGSAADTAVLQLGQGHFPPLRTIESRRARLPRRSGRLIDRETDLELVRTALSDAPVVTVVGPGGVGKTRLALEAVWTADLPRNRAAWFVELAEIAASDDVARAVAGIVGAKEAAGLDLTASVVAALQVQPGLLVLDNCEHVIDGAAELASRIAARCPDVRVLATSREALAVAGERLVALAPLDPSRGGVELFDERAAAVSATYDPVASRQDSEEICRRLDGLPLAIELAAARTTSLTTGDLVARLDDRLRLLDGRRRGGDERHRTLRTTLQWSYDLLTAQEQGLFLRLSVFTGPFDAAAAVHVSGDDRLDVTTVDDLLVGFAERSLLMVEAGQLGRRYRLLETMREFGANLLAAAGQAEQAAGLHADWCLHEARHAHRLLPGPDELEGVARVEELWPNLRAAFDWACARGDLELADALVRPVASELGLRGRLEIGTWAERILGLMPADDNRVLYWLLWATQRVMERGDQAALDDLVGRHGGADHPIVLHAAANLEGTGEELVVSSRAAVTWLAELGEGYLADWMEIVGVAAGLLRSGQFDEHDAFVTALADRHREGGPPTFLHWALFMRGYSALFRGEYERAEQLLDQAAAVEIPAGTFSANGPAAARAAFRRGDRARALQLLRDHIVELLATDNTLVASRLVGIEFVTIMAAIGRFEDAACVLGNLETAGEFWSLILSTVIADTAETVAAHGDRSADRERGSLLDDRAALAFMRDAIDAAAGSVLD